MKRIAARITAALAMIGVIAFVVAVSVPAAAFHSATDPQMPVAEEEIALQSLASGAVEHTAAAPRDTYTVTPRVEKIRAKYAQRTYTYRANPEGTVQWPFPFTVPIASGFGDRSAPCSGCSTRHEGIDFLPGAGTPIGAIMPGVVVAAEAAGGGYGHHVVIEHVVNGRSVQSLYAHMLAGSITVAVGDTVHVGQVLGGVGSTGASTGAHLHLEIHMGGVPIDPYVWLTANAT